MNCWKGICKYSADDGLCLKDGGACDIEKVGQHHTCHYERENVGFLLSCRNVCISYDWCEET